MLGFLSTLDPGIEWSDRRNKNLRKISNTAASTGFSLVRSRAGFDRSFDLDANAPGSIGTWVCANHVISEPPITHAVTSTSHWKKGC